MTTEATVFSDLAVPPGEYLEEVLDSLSMTKDELARRMDRPATKLNAIYKGEKEITPETALQLEMVLGIPAYIWTGLEKEYQLTLARQSERCDVEAQVTLAKGFPYKELCRLNFVSDTRKASERARQLLKFFGVTSLENVPQIRQYAPAFRLGNRRPGHPSASALASWLRIGELQAQEMECAEFDKFKLKNSLASIRRLTLEPPSRFEPRLNDILSHAGVALVICPHLPKTYANGAVFWMGGTKPVLLLTLRGSWGDIFWFTLFHELGHILLHNANRVFVDTDFEDPLTKTYEEEADAFAADTLMPEDQYRDFIDRGSFTKRSVREFASQIEIHSGIIVGRLHKDRLIPQDWLNDLRVRLVWK